MWKKNTIVRNQSKYINGQYYFEYIYSNILCNKILLNIINLYYIIGLIKPIEMRMITKKGRSEKNSKGKRITTCIWRVIIFSVP